MADVGAEHGDVNVSAFLFNGAPGSGPGPHRHPYDEVQFIQWVAAGAPRFSFLVREEEIAMAIEGEGVGDTHAGRDGCRPSTLRFKTSDTG